MKKRVAALLMALVMLVGLLPSAVWAEVAVTPDVYKRQLRDTPKNRHIVDTEYSDR